MPRTKPVPPSAPPAAPDVRLVRLDTLYPDPDNVRVHPENNLKAIRESLTAFGQQRPLVVMPDGLVLAGNGTLEAARQLGWQHIAVQVCTLPLDQARAYAVADNRTGELSSWNETGLATLLRNLHEQALPLPGWDEAELRRLCAAPMTEIQEGDIHPDRGTELRELYGVEPGQLWQCGPHRVMCGDCTDKAVVERLMQGEKFDVLCTDPPYSSGGQFRSDRAQPSVTKYVQTDSIQTYRGGFAGDNRDQRSFVLWTMLWLSEGFARSQEGSLCLLFTDWRQLPTLSDALQVAGWVWRNLVTWWKPGIRMQHGRFSLSAEYVLYASNGVPQEGECSPQNVLQHAPVAGEEKQHIAEKPLALLRELLGVSMPTALVYDPFLGSGVTLIAAYQLNRRCYGIEIDPTYVAVSLERWSRLTNQSPVLVEP